MDRKVYTSDVSDNEWAFAAPNLTLMLAQVVQLRAKANSYVTSLTLLGRTV